MSLSPLPIEFFRTLSSDMNLFPPLSDSAKLSNDEDGFRDHVHDTNSVNYELPPLRYINSHYEASKSNSSSGNNHQVNPTDPLHGSQAPASESLFQNILRNILEPKKPKPTVSGGEVEPFSLLGQSVNGEAGQSRSQGVLSKDLGSEHPIVPVPELSAPLPASNESENSAESQFFCEAGPSTFYYPPESSCSVAQNERLEKHWDHLPDHRPPRLLEAAAGPSADPLQVLLKTLPYQNESIWSNAYTSNQRPSDPPPGGPYLSVAPHSNPLVREQMQNVDSHTEYPSGFYSAPPANNFRNVNKSGGRIFNFVQFMDAITTAKPTTTTQHGTATQSSTFLYPSPAASPSTPVHISTAFHPTAVVQNTVTGNLTGGTRRTRKRPTAHSEEFDPLPTPRPVESTSIQTIAKPQNSVFPWVPEGWNLPEFQGFGVYCQKNFTCEFWDCAARFNHGDYTQEGLSVLEVDNAFQRDVLAHISSHFGQLRQEAVQHCPWRACADGAKPHLKPYTDKRGVERHLRTLLKIYRFCSLCGKHFLRESDRKKHECCAGRTENGAARPTKRRKVA
ncbi:hypothetical protein H0H81_010721 [Sphagnurus paluster]|uniref:Uncharacterized protein n=1 Tax=Sphagnurus paluster TaxID=117069 RepID=A0A9P7KFZ0_9AGAR|nr:hypothetical protein H0H81_010721 [Sphagnurus paluster]